jgi:hypothetical protein
VIQCSYIVIIISFEKKPSKKTKTAWIDAGMKEKLYSTNLEKNPAHKLKAKNS